MSKTETKQEDAKSSTEVAVKEEGALPSFLDDYQGPLGTEDIQNEDVAIPRLKLAQAMSDEVKSGVMAEGDLYINITGQVVAKTGEPLLIIPVATGKEFMLWRDRKDGGGIMARAHRVLVNGEVKYAWDNPDTEFTHKVGGKIGVTWKTGKYIEEDGLAEWGSEIPGDKESGIAATAHHNYVMVLPEHDNMVVAVSLSRSQAKRARDFNGMLKLGRLPIFARLFKLSTEEETSGDNKYANFRFKPAGNIDSEELFAFTSQLSQDFAMDGFKVDQSDADKDVSSVSEEAEGKAF